ncbi:MAG TPA: hypothetical protein VGN72_07140 [Tepidisphaeraceae bacterium]|jgi:hypothetical protein|nr:hypothetical protein [Tepidisphaeraceae bacterium]
MPDIDTDPLLWIVTGVSLTAELGDRPLAYRIEEEVRQRLRTRLPAVAPGQSPRLSPVVVSDVFFLNNEELQSRPAISVGGPGVNMLSGTLVERLPTVLAVDNVLVVQMDPEFEHLQASVWGMTHVDTVRAIDLFVTKYLDAYLDGIVEHGLADDDSDDDE